MFGNKVCVVIPFYRETLSEFEKMSLRRCQEVLGDHHKIAIKPQKLNAIPDDNKIKFDDIISFGNEYFEGLKGYNRLMLSTEFYRQFIDFEYILIYQLDCFVFKDELLYWCDKGFDYIGAPWIKKTYHKNAVQLLAKKIETAMSFKHLYADNSAPNQYQLAGRVGNGGFSLRKVKKFLDITLVMRPVIEAYLMQSNNLYNEDVFWSIEVNKAANILNIPPAGVALKFAFEVPPAKPELISNADLPFGCHDWDNYLDFWRPIFKRYQYDI